MFGIILLLSGVKQGDPSAMQLFILGYDPLIRFIDSSLSFVDHLLLPFCDDLALACTNVSACWATIVRCFAVIEKISCLALNTDKTQFLLTSRITCEDDAVAILEFDDTIDPSQLMRAIKYLGIFLGQNHVDCNWEAALLDYLDTAKFISLLDCGLLTKISLYNMLAISKLSFVASFVPPNLAAKRAESRALQILARGPWNALHPGLLKGARSLGMPSQASDLQTLSLAARTRVAHITSKNVLALNLDFDRLFNSNEIVLCFLDRKLFQSSCIGAVCEAYRDFLAMHDVVSLGTFSQKKVYQALLPGATPFDIAAFLQRKLSILLGDVPSRDQVTVLINVYSFISKKFAFALTFTHIRAVCNHWCTRSRFGNKTSGCVFGCGHENDRITHSICCTLFWDFFFECIKIHPISISLEEVLLLSDDIEMLCCDRQHVIMIGLHILFLTFNSCRHGAVLDKRLVNHHLVHFCRSHRAVARRIDELALVFPCLPR